MPQIHHMIKHCWLNPSGEHQQLMLHFTEPWSVYVSCLGFLKNISRHTQTHRHTFVHRLTCSASSCSWNTCSWRWALEKACCHSSSTFSTAAAILWNTKHTFDRQQTLQTCSAPRSPFPLRGLQFCVFQVASCHLLATPRVDELEWSRLTAGSSSPPRGLTAGDAAVWSAGVLNSQRWRCQRWLRLCASTDSCNLCESITFNSTEALDGRFTVIFFSTLKLTASPEGDLPL